MGQIQQYRRKWNQTPSFERKYLLKAFATLTCIKLGLLILPFHTFRRIFARLTKRAGSQRFSEVQMNQVALSVNRMADFLPFTLLCLPRALAVKYLLRNEPDLTLEIGVEIGRIDSFEAHAWVERDGKIIIGDWNEQITYQRLWSWE
ncbi:lasso peptide biosynthesis B2 protein [Dyadobacter tibetensis]|uniref:lasso peptide biosynthesis B2 protein n=1 Tax=Dyadobacter tibetensis TaxID=1211851 RepID=UPI0004701AC4|nr:lasso peptide biosynthesis B2 protein [Dyadobacter tibetensis]